MYNMLYKFIHHSGRFGKLVGGLEVMCRSKLSATMGGVCWILSGDSCKICKEIPCPHWTTSRCLQQPCLLSKAICKGMRMHIVMLFCRLLFLFSILAHSGWLPGDAKSETQELSSKVGLLSPGHYLDFPLAQLVTSLLFANSEADWWHQPVKNFMIAAVPILRPRTLVGLCIIMLYSF